MLLKIVVIQLLTIVYQQQSCHIMITLQTTISNKKLNLTEIEVDTTKTITIFKDLPLNITIKL